MTPLEKAADSHALQYADDNGCDRGTVGHDDDYAIAYQNFLAGAQHEQKRAEKLRETIERVCNFTMSQFTTQSQMITAIQTQLYLELKDYEASK